jgi:hypothetical protein
MNNIQEAYDIMCEKLWYQNGLSLDTNTDDICLYRSQNGNCCAIGHLMADDIYNNIFEGNVVDDLIDIFLSVNEDSTEFMDSEILTSQKHIDFFKTLQNNIDFYKMVQTYMHDDYSFSHIQEKFLTYRDFLVKGANAVASEYKLIPFDFSKLRQE